MFLKRIELQGFKSFANKTELRFNRDLTVIVGPNGSGKSNIVDAIRWATGEQGQKLLRTKKTEEVIFAGSDRKSRLGMAEVNLYIDNSSKRIPIDYNEVVLTRRIYRNGENEYIINKNKVRLIDIQLLLAKANFGQHNYSIIGQGMIDSILGQSVATRKSFFDEATGVKVYQIKKDKAQLKYISTQNNLQQSKNILSEISPHLRYLTRQVNKLSKKQEIQKNLEKLQNDYYGFRLSNIKKKIKSIEEQLKLKNNIKNKLEKDLNEIQNKLNDESKDSYAKEFNERQDEYNKLINLKNKLLHDKVVYQGKFDLELSNIGKNNLAWLNNQKNNLEQEYNDNENNLSKYSKEVEKLKNELKGKIKKQEEFVERIKDIQSQLQNNIKSKAELESDEIKNKIKNLNNKVQNIIKNIESIGYKELKKEIYFISKEIEYLNNKINKEDLGGNVDYNELQNKFQKYLITKDSFVNEIYELKNQKNILNAKVKDLVNKQEEIKNKLEKISLEIEMASSKDKSKVQEQIQNIIDDINKKINDLDSKAVKIKEEIENLNTKNEESRKNFFKMQKQAKDIQDRLNEINYKIQDINIELAKNQAHCEDVNEEIKQEDINLENLNYDNNKLDTDQVFAKVNRFKKQLNQIGGIEDDAQDEFDEVKTKHEFLKKQIIDLEKASKNLKKIINNLNDKIEHKFSSNFEKINSAFDKYFKILFNGGKASLSIKREIQTQFDETENNEQDETFDNKSSEDEYVEKDKLIYKGKNETISDIIISVKLPGKKSANMNFLSGGEKALISIALICSIIYNNPSPFVVLDEVDATLDEANSERFAEIIDQLKDKTQFICITHNRATMHKAEILYGTSMDSNGVSKLLSVNFKEAEKYSE